jgi:hypothetical protein
MKRSLQRLRLSTVSDEDTEDGRPWRPEGALLGAKFGVTFGDFVG